MEEECLTVEYTPLHILGIPVSLVIGAWNVKHTSIAFECYYGYQWNCLNFRPVKHVSRLVPRVDRDSIISFVE